MDDRCCTDFIDNLLTGKILNNLETESIRGCMPTIYLHPVKLEPYYQAFNSSDTYIDNNNIKLSLPLRRISKRYFSQIMFPIAESIQWDLVDNAIASLSGFS